MCTFVVKVMIVLIFQSSHHLGIWLGGCSTSRILYTSDYPLFFGCLKQFYSL